MKSDAGQAEAALASHLEALRLRKDQYSRHSTNHQASPSYAISLNRTAAIRLALGRDLAAAADAFAGAAAIGRQLTLQTPSDVYALAELARCYRGHAELAARSKDKAGAAGLLRQSAELWHDVRKRAPLDVELAAAAGECDQALTRWQGR